MPIKSAVVGEPESSPEDQTATQTAAAPADEPTAEAPKKKRRTKAELIEAAVVPTNDAVVEVKFAETGSAGERPWLVAVELFRDKKIEFVDKTLKYAVEKMDQQKKAGGAKPSADDEVAGLTGRWVELQRKLDETSSTEETSQLAQEAELVRNQIVELGGLDPSSDEAYAARHSGVESGKRGDQNIPSDAEVGDEIRVNGDTYRLGHGRVLTQGMVGTPSGEIIHAKNRWQRELGTGGKGPWEKTVIQSDGGVTEIKDVFGAAGAAVEQAPEPASVPAVTAAEVFKGEPVVSTVEQVRPGVYRVTMGYLEKIGLPDYSSLAIGPATVTHEVADDGRRTEVNMGGRLVKLPTSVIEGMQESAQIAEFVMRSERQAMVSFLESVKPGSTKPASA